MSNAEWRLGLDLGGTGCRAVAVANDGTVLASETRPTPAELDRSAAVEFVLALLEALAQPEPPVSAGIGASGPIDNAGVIRNPDTLAAFSDLPLVADLSAELQIPVAIDNDAVTAAVAEQQTGAARDARAFLHLTLGTGVGICMITPTGPFRGADGTHPEASHFSVAHRTGRCYCGRSTCFEQGGSRAALQRASAGYLGLAANDPEAIPQAHRAALGGDSAARAVFDQYGTVLADGLSTLISIFRPPLVVLGGSAAQAYDSFQSSVHDAFRRLHAPSPPPVVATMLNDFGGAIGAAHLSDRV